MRHIFCLVLLLVCPLGCFGQNSVAFEGIDIPLRVTSFRDEYPLQLVGYALRVRHGEKVYVATIFSNEKYRDTSKMLKTKLPIRMRLYVLGETTGYTAQKLWMDSVVINSSEQQNLQYAEDILKFKESINKTYVAGDIIDIEYTPESGMILYFNGSQASTWDDRGFFNMALNTWIGPHPPSREFKRAILNFPVKQ